MRKHLDPSNDTDTGLLALVMLARLHDVPADPERIRHEYATGPEPLDEVALLRALRRLGLHVRAMTCAAARLDQVPLPALAQFNDGSWRLVARLDGDRVLLQDPRERAPQLVPRDAFVSRWGGRLILCSRRHRISAGVGHGFLWFVPALVRYRQLFAEVVVASLCVQLLALATPLFFQVVIDKVLVHRGMTTLDVLAIGFLAVALFEVVLGGLRSYLLGHTCARIDVELGARLFRHLLRLPLGYFLTRRTGDTVARVRELDTVRQFMTSASLTLLLDLGFSLLFLVVMWFYSPSLTLAVVAILPGYVLLSVFVTPPLRRRVAERFDRGADNHAFLVEAVSGIEVIKGIAAVPQWQRRWEAQLAAYVQATFKAANLSNIAGQCAAFLNRLTVLVILWLGARLVIDGALSVGQLVAFNMLAARVNGPVLRLVQTWQEFQQAALSVRRLGDILHAPAESGHDRQRSNPARLHGKIQFDRVHFRYRPDAHDVIDGLSLEVRSGEVLGIVGRSGSGKSTLARLLLQFHSPTGGAIRIDGRDLSVFDPDWLRRHIGVVPQEARLFNRSVRENIALAAPGMPLERIVRAARLAGAEEFIDTLPDGYDTQIGEEGAFLSGGQRQRLAIARALVTNPDLLILDEATSALDYESEAIVRDNLARICKGRTVIIIAHRLSAIQRADRVVVIEKGRVVEQGDHRQLLDHGGHYARLHACQAAV